MNIETNKIKLYGKVCSPLTENKLGAVNFYLETVRNSYLKNDVLPCIADAELIRKYEVEKDNFINFEGEVQTSMGFNRETGLYNKLYVFNYAKNISNLTKQLGENWRYIKSNELKLFGNICKKSEVRETFLGKKVIDFSLAVETECDKFKKEHYAYIPCVAFNGLAEEIARYELGDLISCYGMMQARDFQKGGLQGEKFKRTAYEASIFSTFNTGENNRLK